MPSRVASYYLYTTKDGDSFTQLAFDFLGHEQYADRIVRFNPDHADVLLFDAGEKLRIPIYDQEPAMETVAPWDR